MSNCGDSAIDYFLRSLNLDTNQVCIAQLDPLGQIGIDRITVTFEIDDRRVLLATVRDLRTETVLIMRQAIGTLE